jgi:two-component system sensor histidine kinase BaeS
MPRSLGARLLIAFLVVIAAALGTVAIAVTLVGPGYFLDAMGHLPGDPMGEAMAEDTLVAFTDAMREALIAATIIAVLTATVVSLLVAARIARPVGTMARAARRIADGDYDLRVRTDEPGELGELASSFNEMAGSLKATERRRLQLVGDVAHELRTPLATLDGYLEGLEDGVINPSPQTWHLLRAETARLTRLVSELSELWRAEAHQLPLQLEAVDLVGLCREVGQRFAPQASARAITLGLPEGVAVARADRDRVAQVLANYLSNALRHAPDGSMVEVAVRATGSRVRVSVRDSGPGLEAGQLEAVFERFYRVDAARSRSMGGSGIGLAIVRALADAMEGAVWAESDGPGRGATFFLELPAA